MNGESEGKSSNDDGARVQIVDITVPFRSMVILLVKLAIAVVPAAVIVYLAYSVIFAVIGKSFS